MPEAERTLRLQGSSAAPEELGAIDPLVLVRARGECSLEPAEDRPVVGMRERDENHAPMSSSRLHPAADDRDEVAQVVRDHDPLLLDCERQHFFIGEAAERLVLVECEHVVTGTPQRLAEAPVRDMRVEEDAQRLRVGSRERGERVELPQLRDRPPVVADLLVDLLRVALVVGLGQLHRSPR
jgi:hypothetical protein